MNQPHSTSTALRRSFVGALGLVAAGLCALAVDKPISLSRPTLTGRNPVEHVWTVLEVFGDGMGVLAIAGAILLLDAGRREYLPRILACAFGGGLAANFIKAVMVRSRPRAFDFDGSVLESFDGLRLWATLQHGGAAWQSGLQSFPSAHTATAAGFAVGLSWLYPRGRFLFALLAALVALQRIAVGAHFLSDTLVGAAVGWVVGACCIDRRGLGKRFDTWEAALRKRRARGCDATSSGSKLEAEHV